ncbi:hypothetical protein C9374_003953 [Naegleria lovaniensis]|uniref:Uncharacterized protein n=1 Tax=Naegleria lovaniensis TaxID=51637 RepID=A0AA88H6D1_NAELO|nr:uncharacterized protein C9374_003953 [Naegleria lovaniensis]KAG2394189.1 hypothetical protein C9374_003953 [Naegleria lovaniensis]
MLNQTHLLFTIETFLPFTTFRTNHTKIKDRHARIRLSVQGIAGRYVFQVLVISKLANLGNYGAGKTSFLRASLLDIPPTSSQAFTTIGIDFGLRMFVLGDSCKVKLQMWDQFGPGRFRSITASYYRGASVIYCLIDLTDQNQWLESKIRCICEHAPDGAEIIVIGTKADLHDKRKMLRRDLEKLAFETFKGSLYLEITNMKIEEPQTVVLYSVLFRYLLSANKMTSEKK